MKTVDENLDSIYNLAEDIVKLLPKDVFCDFDRERINAKNKYLYTFYISDLKFYLEDLKFKKFSKILKKKYKQIYFIFAYKKSIFNNN